MMMPKPTRRSMMAFTGGAALLAALGYRAFDRGVLGQGEEPAFEPWKSWRGRMGEGAERPLHAALLAANACNAQPWLFAPEDERIALLADRRRHLGQVDPFRREMYIGLGCALANLQVAAARFGYATTVRLEHGRLEPSRATEPIAAARIALQAQGRMQTDASAKPNAPLANLFESIPNRHTDRSAYVRGRAISPAMLERLFGSYGENVQIVAIEDKSAREDISSIIMEATERFVADKAMAQDRARWLRTGRRAVLDSRDGLSIDTAGASPATAALTKLLPDPTLAATDAAWHDTVRDVQIPTAALFGQILVRDRMDVSQTLCAGIAWQIFHLTATQLGLSAQPLCQPVEMADRNLVLGRQDYYKSALAGLTDWQDWDPTFVFRIGYGTSPAPLSPRRPLSDVLRVRKFA